MRTLLIALMVSLSISASAKIENPVHWSFSAKKLNDKEAILIMKATIDKGWHLYSQYINEGGPIPTSFKFIPDGSYSLVDSVNESPKAINAFDPNFNMQISWHEQEVTFQQKILLKDASVTVKGIVEFMVCNNQKCLPPDQLEFAIPVSGSVIQEKALISTQNTSDPKSSLWGIFIAGFFGGLAAFFMPCIYPMIPLTVSFFTKRSGSRANGIKTAIIYGLSIIAIYVSLGLLITVIFGASALNEAASSATFNLLFFCALILFGISFLGAFEITLPSSLVNKMDQKSDQGGWIGLFFMAFTLSLVSFSCTGPIIGTLLVDAVTKGAYEGPAVGMLGFSSALAIPFTLFAIFPSWLKGLPASGGWLNSVKISLGLLELALALKFLSNVDLAYHWGILSRDIFLVLWIVIFGILALYLLGKIRFSHDSEPQFISLPRLFFAMLVLSFTLYMVPGLFGAPLKAISGWLPPQATQDFNLASGMVSNEKVDTGKKYSNLFHAPHGLNAYYDYEEGLAYAKKVNKPVLLDFTGWSCTNCRKMEASVWSDPQVLDRLKNDYVLISLYVDDKTELNEKDKYISTFSGKSINTLGQKWSDFQASRFNTNSQPYYVIANPDGKELLPPEAFNLDISNYIRFLDNGKNSK